MAQELRLPITDTASMCHNWHEATRESETETEEEPEAEEERGREAAVA